MTLAASDSTFISPRALSSCVAKPSTLEPSGWSLALSSTHAFRWKTSALPSARRVSLAVSVTTALWTCVFVFYSVNSSSVFRFDFARDGGEERERGRGAGESERERKKGGERERGRGFRRFGRRGRHLAAANRSLILSRRLTSLSLFPVSLPLTLLHACLIEARTRPARR